MPNIAQVMREEIQRLARKEVRVQTRTLQRLTVQHRRAIADLKRQIAGLQGELRLLAKTSIRTVTPSTSDADGKKRRFSAKGIRKHRQRLGLSADAYGKLAGVSALAVYNWERGVSRPRASQLAVLAEINKLGKREAEARLEQLAGKR